MVASIPSPESDGFSLGPLDIRFYGLCYIAAVIAAVLITSRRWRAVGGSTQLVEDVALWGFPAGLVGGRLYYVITSWNQVPDEWWGPFAVWEGGLGLPGGIFLGVVVGLWRVRRAGVPLGPFMDAGAPGLLVAQAIGRIGNWFNQELFGKPTSLPWALEIKPENRPARFADEPMFQPTFLYEILWDLSLAATLAWLGHHHRIRPPGLFALYVGGYGAFRMGMELLRVDPANEILGMRLNFYVAALLTLAGFTGFAQSQRRTGKRADGTPGRQ